MNRGELIELGFKPTRYKNDDGEYLVLHTKIQHLEKASKLIDGDWFFEDMDAIVETCPNNSIQLYIAEADHQEMYSLDSEEGVMLLAEAKAAASKSIQTVAQAPKSQ